MGGDGREASGYYRQRFRTALMPITGRSPTDRFTSRLVYVFIEHISLPRDVAGFADRVFDLLQSQVIHGAGLGNDVFLNHETAHVVGAKEESELPNLRALRHPRGLNVRDVVEVKPGDRLRLQVLMGARWRHLGHGRVFRLKRPADKGGEAAGLVLELAQA